MEPLRIAAGTKVLIGAPTIPMAKHLSDAIGETLSRVPGVIEAHLPQCFVAGVMDDPAQILVVVVESKASIAPVLESLGSRLPKILPDGMHLDVWPIQSTHTSLAAVRKANCQVS